MCFTRCLSTLSGRGNPVMTTPSTSVLLVFQSKLAFLWYCGAVQGRGRGAQSAAPRGRSCGAGRARQASRGCPSARRSADLPLGRPTLCQFSRTRVSHLDARLHRSGSLGRSTPVLTATRVERAFALFACDCKPHRRHLCHTRPPAACRVPAPGWDEMRGGGGDTMRPAARRLISHEAPSAPTESHRLSVPG